MEVAPEVGLKPQTSLERGKAAHETLLPPHSFVVQNSPGVIFNGADYCLHLTD